MQKGHLSREEDLEEKRSFRTLKDIKFCTSHRTTFFSIARFRAVVTEQVRTTPNIGSISYSLIKMRLLSQTRVSWQRSSDRRNRSYRLKCKQGRTSKMRSRTSRKRSGRSLKSTTLSQCFTLTVFRRISSLNQ